MLVQETQLKYELTLKNTIFDWYILSHQFQISHISKERERKRKEESDPGKVGAGNSPQDSLENYNPDAKSPNDDDSSQVSTPPDPNSIPSHGTFFRKLRFLTIF